MIKLLLLFVLTIGLFADEFKAGLSYLKFNYVETNTNGEFLDSENSGFKDINGFNLSYKYDIGTLNKNSQLDSLKLEVKYNKGQSNYDGFLQNIKTGQIISKFNSVTNNELFEPKLTLQRTTYTKNYDVGLFVSYGMRDWTRDMTTNPYGYKEVYNWKYYDYGLDIVAYDGAWELGIKCAYQKAIDPIMDAYINGKTRFNLGKTKGYYYKIPLGYNINKNLKLELEYEYNRWDIGKSNTVNNMYEPQSQTKNRYLSLNIAFRF